MANCPNCGQETLRTKDWACQWCGYPLLSGTFQQIQKTYKEIKAERLETAVPLEADMPESDAIAAREAVAEIPESVIESGPSGIEPAGEVEPEAESFPDRGPTDDTGITEEPVSEASITEMPGVTSISVSELSRLCEANSENAEAWFAGGSLRISGEVGRIPRVESTENPSLILVDPEKSATKNVLGVFDKQYEEAINELSVGQMVTVQGKYDGCIINILVTDCVLID